VTLFTKRACDAQVLVCALGCCCGRTDRNKPPVPVDYLKREWKARRLNPRVQLTMTGCLGPCDLVNVVGILSAEGMTWLGGLTEPWHFEALIDWATAVHTAGNPLPLPASLAPHRLSRFPTLSSPPPAPPVPVTSDAA
jgi:hypothetical protein